MNNKKINITQYYAIKNILYIEDNNFYQYGIITNFNNIYKLMLY